MVTISNGILTAKFAEIGAELKSLVKDEKEYIWQGGRYWHDSAPILFPVCSNLKNKEYIYNGKTYCMQSHGFARFSPFEVESKCEDSVTFLLSSQKAKKEYYPFDYELRITYLLEGNRLCVNYNVRNLTDGEMYFSIGAHEGYACEEEIENYEVIFDCKETFAAYQLQGDLLSDETIIVGQDCYTISLKREYFRIDGLIFKNLKSRGVVLRNKISDQKIRVEFPGFDYLLIWTLPGAPFLCIEPWCGITDNVKTNQNLAEKEGIQILKKGETFDRNHFVEIV